MKSALSFRLDLSIINTFVRMFGRIAVSFIKLQNQCSHRTCGANGAGKRVDASNVVNVVTFR